MMQEEEAATITSIKCKYVTIPKEFVCGGVASMINVSLVFPLHKTVFFQQLDGITWIAAFRRLNREGVRQLYRGVLPPLLQRGTSASIMFGFQSQAERWLHSHQPTHQLSITVRTMISALTAGCLEAALTPFERVQTLLQSQKYAHTFKNTPDALSALLKHHGLAELYRGLTPIILRNCTGDVLYFCGKLWLYRKSRSAELPFYQRRLSDFLIGGLLGSCIGAVIFPLSVAKTKMQSFVGSDFISLRYTLLSLLREGQISRLYCGLPANFIRSMVSWGIITMVYEWLLSI